MEKKTGRSLGLDPEQMTGVALQGEQVETGVRVGLNHHGQCVALTQGSQRLPLVCPGIGHRCLEPGRCSTTQGLPPEGLGEQRKGKGQSVERR